MPTPTLYDRMRSLAAAGHPRASELRRLASEFETASARYFDDEPPAIDSSALIRAWQAARRLFDACAQPRRAA